MENSKTFYYARVSTKGQSLDRQIVAFRELGADDRDIIVDKSTGTNLDRAGYQFLKNSLLRNGDTLVIKSLDRLGRNRDMVMDELAWLRQNGIRLKVMDIPTTMMDIDKTGMSSNAWVLEMVTNILIEVYSSVAQGEYERITERRKEGYNAMPTGADGKKHSTKTGKGAVGRPVYEKPANWDEVVTEYKAGTRTAKSAMETLGMKKSTFYKLLGE